MQQFVLRFLEAFGPASVNDIGQFSTLSVPPVREAVAALGDALVRHEGPDGDELLDVAGWPSRPRTRLPRPG